MEKNKVLSEMFDRMADALELLDENPYKIRAYRRAARVLSDLPEDVEEIYREKGRAGLESIPGIGERVASKIVEFIETGRMHKYEEIMAQVPQGLLELMDVPGLGPKTLRLAYEKLGVQNLDDLKRAMRDGRLVQLPGMGPKKVENIRKGLELVARLRTRLPLGLAFPLVESIVERMKTYSEVKAISPAGSFRRMKETVGDLDILVTGTDGLKIITRFTELPGVTRILAKGDTKGSCIFENKYQVDMRVVPRESWGAALQYFTGSKAHNIHLRTIARSMGLKISEYGVFRGNKKVAGETEESVYRALGMQWVPPEMREDWGEIELAQKGKLPKLVGYDQIRGDLHVHSTYSDGTSTLEDIARYGIQMGYEYIAVCDHSQGVRYARGLGVERLKKKAAEIRQINKKYQGKIRLLLGTEVDILQDGSLDYPDEILRELDFVVASVHIWGKDEDVTPRILKAMENPYVHAIGHPTGRLITTREGYHVDLEAIIEKAVETGTLLEINAYYERLDLWDVYIRTAKEKGARFVIGTDSHNVGGFWQIRLGIGQARRGWLEPHHVVNTLPLDALLDTLKALKKKAS